MPDAELDDDTAALVASRTEPERFAQLFDRLANEVHRYLSYRSGRDAEDLTGETFARAFASRERFDPTRGSARGWLFGIATNVLRQRRRAEGRRQSALDRDRRLTPRVGATEDAASRVVDRERITRALMDLDDKSQDVVYLVAAVGLSYEDAATALGVPIGTVRSRYSRARRRLAASLADSEVSLPQSQ